MAGEKVIGYVGGNSPGLIFEGGEIRPFGGVAWIRRGTEIIPGTNLNAPSVHQAEQMTQELKTISARQVGVRRISLGDGEIQVERLSQTELPLDAWEGIIANFLNADLRS